MITNRYRRIAAASLVITGLAACSDNPASPLQNDAEVAAAINAPAAAPVRAPRAAINAAVGASNPADTLAVSFQVGPEGGVFALGRHWISFPANSVCDMSQTSYGVGEWNNLCATATEPVTINALVFADTAGHPHVEFAQHLRFDPTKQVILHMTFDYKSEDGELDILWKRTGGAEAVDEGEVDPAMITREGDEWMVYRRVKHFSGYTVSTFLRADVEGEGEGEVLGIDLGIGLNRIQPIPTPAPLQSGHVVATGRATQEP